MMDPNDWTEEQAEAELLPWLSNSSPMKSTHPPTPRKRRYGTAIRIPADRLLDLIYARQGITVCRLPDITDVLQVKSVQYDALREELEIFATPDHTADPENDRGSYRLHFFELAHGQEPPEIPFSDERIVLSDSTDEETLRELLQDPYIGRQLRILAKAILSIMLSE